MSSYTEPTALSRVKPLAALAAVFLLASPVWAGLRAAAGKADITPDPARETVWLAGYGASGRRAQGVRDPFYARAWVVSDGRKTAALVAVDSIGIYREDVEKMRAMLGWTGGDKYLFVAATHDHSAPDMLGLWGRFPGVSGVDRRYHERLLGAVVSLVRDLSSRMEEVQISAARADLDPRGLCRDSRDPVVIDPELDAAQLRAKSGKILGTLVRWSCHPEVMGKDNLSATADFPGALCARVEEKTGGACLYFSGVIGGLMTPDMGRSPGVEHDYAERKRIGERLADEALGALGKAGRAPGEGVSFKSKLVRLPVENSRYLLFLRSLVFGHKLLDAEGRPLARWKSYWLPLRHLIFFPLPDRLRPWIESEASYVRIGGLEILGIPGELFPELAIGGYDGRYRFGHPLIRPDNPNPPRLGRAPAGPYLRGKLGRHGVLVGLANDEIGYIVPPYDFQIAPGRFLWPRLPGTHYEETNSIGPSAAPILLKAFDGLLAP